MTSAYRWMPICLLALSLGLTGCNSSEPSSSVASKAESLQQKPTLQAVEVMTLAKTAFENEVHFPGELKPYETVEVYPKVEGFLQEVYVDRGAHIKQGQLLARLIAPELDAQLAEANSKVKAIESEKVEAEAKFLSDQGVYQRFAAASKTPGAVAENELETTRLTMASSKAKITAIENTKNASFAHVSALKRIHNYLQVTAPIEGVIIQRNLHPGALVGPSGAGAQMPIFKIENLSTLRLVVALPERFIASIKNGTKIPFKVSAYPGEKFEGIIHRASYALEEKTRTETVEMDVQNPQQKLTPGMYTEVLWPIQRTQPTFMVPNSAVVTTSEKIVVLKLVNHKIQSVDVEEGFTKGDQVEVFGSLNDGDVIVTKATDELRDGTEVAPHAIK